MIITIDGPAGTGKSTIAKMVAKKLHFVYFDTGAMYRSFTYYAIQQNVDISDENALKALLDHFVFEIIQDPTGSKKYFVNKQDVTIEIRSSDVTASVSKVSAYKIVREKLLYLQRDFATHENCVFEGRDMGTVVFPKAEIKIFFQADPKIRAQRRYLEMKEKFPEKEFSLDKILDEIKLRDFLDSTRKVSPLKPAKDSIIIDTSDLAVDEVVKRVIECKERFDRKLIFPKMRFGYRFVLFVTEVLAKLFYRHRIYGKEHYIPGSAIIAASHTSFLDPCLVAISCPEEIHFLAKKTLFSLPLLGRLIRYLNSHPISKTSSDAQILKEIIYLLKQNKKVLLFPEGTRSKTGDISSLQQGIGFLVVHSSCSVLPVYVYGTYSIWPIGKKFPRLFGKTACVFGSPIDLSDFPDLSKKEAIVAITNKVESALNALKTWHESGRIGSPP